MGVAFSPDGRTLATVHEDGTVTFLVKSRMVTPWSLSYDPDTGRSQRHIPMRSRLADLAGRL